MHALGSRQTGLQHGYAYHLPADFWVSVESSRDYRLPGVCLLRHKERQLAVGLRLVVLWVLEQVAENLVAPAARSGGVIRARMWIGLRVSQWTGPLLAGRCQAASSSPASRAPRHRTVLEQPHVCHR